MRLVAVLLLAIALFAIWTLIRVEARSSAATTAHPPEGQFIEVAGHPVHYVQKGEGPDLVLIHGASGSTRDWTFDMVDRLATGYRVTVFDRPGLGYTPPLAPNDVTLDEQTDLLVEAAEALGLEAPVVVGQSFGGAVLMNWAVRHPDQMAAAVNIAGATYTWDTGRDLLYRLLAQPVIGPIMGHLIAAWLPYDTLEDQINGVFAPNDVIKGYADYIGPGLILRPQSFVANAQQRHQLLDMLPAQMARYPDISLPLEIIHGDADTTVGLPIHSEPLARAVKGANLVVLEAVGHMPHHVAPEAVQAAIDRAALRAGLKPAY